MPAVPTATEVIAFWRDAGPARWFGKDAAFDESFSLRFLTTHFSAARRELDAWCASPDGMLAMLILLDQFPRNAFRGSAHMFATDPLALAFAREAVELGLDRQVDDTLRLFVYLPFEHSESLTDQERAVQLCAPLGGQYAHFARVHRDVIARFGRFPHRNAALGRQTTAEEQAFLDGGGFSG